MKKSKYIIMFSAALLGASCSDIIESSESVSFPDKEIILTATREALDPGTRSIRLDDGSVWWSPNEEVSVFYGSGSDGGSKFVSMNSSIAETVELQGTIQMSGSGKDFWAVYPYSEDNSCDGLSITTVIPSKQTGVEGNFSDDVFPAMAKGNSTSLPFWNICGGIKFFVSRSDIRSVTFKGNNDEPLAGKVKMVFDADGKPAIAEVLEGESEVTLIAPDGYFKVGKYYYITLLPTALQNGFSISFKAIKEIGAFKSDKQQTIKRSVFGTLKNIDSKVSEWGSYTPIPEPVDLGLSVKWASWNIGATTPEEAGDFYSWGEIEPKIKYSWETYLWCNGSERTLTKYNYDSNYGPVVDNKCCLESSDDAAHMTWKGAWRIPTITEWDELFNNCTVSWQYTSDWNVKGCLFTSNVPGYTDKSIFLPASNGNGENTMGWYSANCCRYWSSSLKSSEFNINKNPNVAAAIEKTNGAGSIALYRSFGCSIRPVHGEFVHVSSITLNPKPSSIVLTLAESERLSFLSLNSFEVSFEPSNASDKTVRWASSDTSIAEIYKNGVRAKSEGQATITAISESGASASFDVTVISSVDVIPYIENNTKAAYSGLELTEGLVFNVNGEQKTLQALEQSGELGFTVPAANYYECGYPADIVEFKSGAYDFSTDSYKRVAKVTYQREIDGTHEPCYLGRVDGDNNFQIRLPIKPASSLLLLNISGSVSGNDVPWGSVSLYSSDENASLSGVVDYNLDDEEYLDSFNFDSRKNSVKIIRNNDYDYSDGILIPLPPQEISNLTISVSDASGRLLYSKERSQAFQFKRAHRYNTNLVIQETHAVTDAVSMADYSYINIPEAIVAALSSKGFIATDGTSNIYVYQNALPSVQIGDKVTIEAQKITYYGLPELINPTINVLSSGNEAPRTELKNITSIIDSYDASVAEYIYVIGKLVKDGNNWNVEVQGASRKATASSLHSSIDPSALEGKQVVMKGYFNTIYQSKNLLQIVVAEIVDAEPEAVDLGLPSGLKWANMNVGAAKPEEYGDYFAWGETQPKTDYRWSKYEFELGTDSNGPFSKYVTISSYGTVDNKTVLDPEDDAAHVNWGGSWRMPTDEECDELINKCTWTWTTQNGVKGRLVTGPNGKSIFLPAAGFRYDTNLIVAGSYGLYWSSSLYTDNPNGAYDVYFGYDCFYRYDLDRYYGQSVRPVYP